MIIGVHSSSQNKTLYIHTEYIARITRITEACVEIVCFDGSKDTFFVNYLDILKHLELSVLEVPECVLGLMFPSEVSEPDWEEARAFTAEILKGDAA